MTPVQRIQNLRLTEDEYWTTCHGTANAQYDKLLRGLVEWLEWQPARNGPVVDGYVMARKEIAGYLREALES